MVLTSDLDKKSRVIYPAQYLYLMRINNPQGLCRRRRNILQNWKCGCRFMERSLFKGKGDIN